MKKRWYIIIIILIILSNIPPIKSIFRLTFDEYHYRYNETGSFTFVEFKGRDMAMLYRKLNSYKLEFPKSQDTVIYRLYKRDILAFWRWGEYIFERKYTIPYKSWRKIKQLRGNINHSNNWQDF